MNKFTLQTPFYNLKDFLDVYEPSEDSHLFLDALEKDSHYLVNLKPTMVCEVGCGSGILVTALASILKDSCCYFCTDINPRACAAAKHTSVLNKTQLECIQMNFMSCLKSKFDVIIFNPPYVVTDEDEIVGSGLNRAYAGGSKGRTITDKFLECLPSMLATLGVCYILLLKENDIPEILEKMTKIGFNNELVIERKVPGEYLYIYKFYKT